MDRSNQTKFDHVFKILIIGDSGVGKSSLLSQYADGTFIVQSQSTVGVDFKIRHVQAQGSDGKYKSVKITLWDTAGQERFRSLTNSYYRGAQAVVLVFDVTKESTFSHIELWQREVMEHSRKAVHVLVANKVDRGDSRVISTEIAAACAESLQMMYFETSAVDRESVNILFNMVVRKILHTPELLVNTKPGKNPRSIAVDEDSEFDLSVGSEPDHSSGCC